MQLRAGRVDVGGEVSARDIIVATGSVPFVPPGIPIDGRTVFTSDHALKLEWVPDWVAIIGSGYIGLEFSDVYTALGSEVTFIEVHFRALHAALAQWRPVHVPHLRMWPRMPTLHGQPAPWLAAAGASPLVSCPPEQTL